MSAYNSVMDADIPVIYTAVSDPAGAGLVNEDGTNVGNITGTSDKLPVTEQMALIRELMPDAKKIGILYTTSEANSVSTIQEYKDHAEEYGFEIVDTGINTIADVEMAAKDLASKVDCISNLTDNTVVSALQTVLAAKVLKGEATAAETPFEICEGGNVYVNTEAAGNIDFTISDDVLGEAAEIYETITVE